IRLGAPLALPDRLHNLGLVRDFGARHLRTRCPLAVEDLLYMAPALRAVSFSIPFGLDSDVDIVMGNPVGVPAGGTLARSASSDSLSQPRRPPRATPAAPPGVPNGVPEPPEPPSIEEALQIIHSSERLLPDGAPDAFFLHSPEPQNLPGTPQNLPQNPPQTPARPMTSFAERKKKLEEATSNNNNTTNTNSASTNPISENLGGVPSTPGGPPEVGGGLSAEMSQLGARLEEKRRAIEAQKKRIEAIFAKHRQRLGQNALQRLRQDEEGVSPPPPPPSLPPSAPPEEELSLGAPQKPPGQYEAAVARLSAALSSLQLDMQRLTQQQERLLLEQRPHGAPQAWVYSQSSLSLSSVAEPGGGRGN
ncbi:hypothetical protein HGM15179_019869, partial [Zosterops borbonicus]